MCGCDGETYSNLCDASSRGVSVVAKGPCPTSGCLSDGAWYAALSSTFFTSRTHTAQHSQAKDNSTYCRFASKCGGNGTCVTAPTFCYHIYKPVCGCDGRTYSNECYAAAAYTSIASIGPCPNDHKEAVEEEQKALLRAGK